MTDPPLGIKFKVTENMVLGRGATASAAQSSHDRDRRLTPGAIPILTSGNSGPVISRLILTYASNLNGLNAAPPLRDLFDTAMNMDLDRGFFLFDELPLDRPPWLQI